MKLVHFAPLASIKRIRKSGISVSRRGRNRLSGVYAVPILDFPKTTISNWRRELSRSRGIRMAAIVFEIPDHDPVYFFRDWSHNALGARNLVSARQAEVLTMQLGRERRTPLTPLQHEVAMAMGDGTVDAYDQPKYDFGMMEIVIPRAIKPSEILRVIMLPNRKKDYLAQAPIELD